MKATSFLIRFMVGVIVMATALANGQTPMGTAFAYQGQLKQSGSPVDGPADFKFTLWDADLPGGNHIADSVPAITSAEVENGLFTALLDFGTGVFTGESRWVQVEVCTAENCAYPVDFTPLTPRQELTPTPYSMYAAYAAYAPSDIAGAGTINHMVKFTDLNTVGNSIVYEANGRVGIGTGAPGYDLEVFNVTGDSSIGIASAGNAGGNQLVRFIDGANSEWHIVRIDGDNTLRVTESGVADAMVFQPGGNVGIGTTNPQGILDVAGPNGGDVLIGVNNVGARIVATDSDGNLNLKPRVDDVGAGVVVRDGNTPKGIRLSGGGMNHIQSLGLDGTSPFALSINPDGGNVGIGTTTPRSSLDVAGEARMEGVRFPGGFGPDSAYVGTSGNNLSFGHAGTSEDFIGYKSNTFYFKDSPGGGDTRDPDVVIGGNVGIGATTPQARLHIGGTPGVDGIMFPDGTVQTSAGTGIGGGGTVGYIPRFSGPNAISKSNMYENPIGGYVGIGTTNPKGNLHIKGAPGALTKPSIVLEAPSAPPDNQVLGLMLAGTTGDFAISRLTPRGELVRTDWMVKASTGDVGIGTTKPHATLDVAGRVNVAAEADESDYCGNFENTGTGGGVSVFAHANTDWTRAALRVANVGSSPAVYARSSGGPAVYANGDLEVVNGGIAVQGDLEVHGAYKGNIGSNNGAPFPRPAWDSGWQDIEGSASKLHFHNLQLNRDLFFIDLQERLAQWNDQRMPQDVTWHSLTFQAIELSNASLSNRQYRVRIWVIPE